MEHCERVYQKSFSSALGEECDRRLGGNAASQRGDSDGVEPELLLHVSLRHVPERLLVFLQQLEDGGQLLALHPGKTESRKKENDLNDVL